MNQGKTRSSLFGIAGGYLCYLAYDLYHGYNEQNTTMSRPVMYLFAALFVLAGAALIIAAVRLWINAGKDGEETPPREDESSLK